jgi:cytochrome c-type biogenesis protein CcmH/NrfG
MRKIIVIFIFSVAILIGGYAGFRWYKVRKQDHLVNLARQFVRKSDEKNALLCLQLVLRANPNNLSAVRMMADLADAAHAPSAVALRQRVVTLNPNSLDDKLSLVQTAIVLHDYVVATNTLASVSADGRKTAAFQNVAGTVAEAANQIAEAEAHFQEAAHLQPTNQAIQLNLAMVRLHGTNVPAQLEGRNVLKRIANDSSNPPLRTLALRELVLDAAHASQMTAALALSKELVQQTNAIFSDQLLRLDLLKHMDDAGYKTMLADLQRGVTNNDGAKISALATWLMANTTPDSTLTWLRSLPMDTQTNQPTALLIAQCLSIKQDWPGLQAWIQKQDWGGMDFLRHAYLAQTLQGQDLAATSETEWQKAVSLANNQKPSLVMLLRLAAQWKWESKGEDILWAIVNKYPDEQWANEALTQILFTSGRTRPLMMLYGQQLKQDLSDFSVENNLAMCALLLDAQEMKPHELALSLFKKDPTNPSYLSTYAFSLYSQKKYAEALKVIEQLTPDQLKKPSIAGYYGIILKANGHPAQAKIYLNLATQSKLLPEEKKLFIQAESGI